MHSQNGPWLRRRRLSEARFAPDRVGVGGSSLRPTALRSPRDHSALFPKTPRSVAILCQAAISVAAAWGDINVRASDRGVRDNDVMASNARVVTLMHGLHSHRGRPTQDKHCQDDCEFHLLCCYQPNLRRGSRGSSPPADLIHKTIPMRVETMPRTNPSNSNCCFPWFACPTLETREGQHGSIKLTRKQGFTA